MKLAILANELPYPPHYGGLVDTWNRLVTLRDLGCRILLIAWQSGYEESRPKKEHCEHVLKFVDDLHLLTFQVGARARLARLRKIGQLPPQVAARLTPAEGFGAVDAAMSAFAPDAIWLDVIQAAPLALQYAKRLGCPYFIRSVNVEERYQRASVIAASTSRKRWMARLSMFGFAHYEEAALRAATRFFDVSIDDLAYWHTRGLNNGSYLPPIMLSNTARTPPQPRTHDVAYLGALNGPLNTHGLSWFFREVVPLIRKAKADFTALIAGANPTDEIRALINACPGAQLRANVSSPSEAYGAGRVLINPILLGSGVNVKSIEMLFQDQPLVGTTFAARGLPPRAAAEFRLAPDARGFAEAVLQALSDAPQPIARDAARALFDERAVKRLFQDLQDHIDAARDSKHLL